MKRLFPLMIGLLVSGSTVTALPADQDIEKRIDHLLSQMTLDEKIGQMNQQNGRVGATALIDPIKAGHIGSVLNLENRDEINEVQRAAVEGSRLRIPLLIGRDVIHGYKTIFPIPLGQAATFNPEVAYSGARIAAVEASSDGIRWTFAPMIDVSRDARWGRIAESSGEDPLLNSVFGAQMVKGFQGDKLSNPHSIAACAKHFFGYGASEAGKDYNSTTIPERLMRNIYFPPFEAAVKAGVQTFMTSFNDNDGIPASGNKRVMTDILRGEWKFDGFVVSDWGAVTEMVKHRFCKDNKEAAMRAVNAGVDMEMVSGSYSKHLKALVDEGKVSVQTLDNLVRNILRVKFRLGLFENPYLDMNAPRPAYRKEHLAEARKAVEQSVVLLKNDKQLLPLKGVKSIAVIGPMADAPHDQLGTWAFDGEKSHTVTPLNALRQEYGKQLQILYAPGVGYSRDRSKAGFAEAVALARKADVILFFGGEEAILSGEAHSLADISLQGAQSDLIGALKETGKPLVITLIAGRPLTIEKEVRQADALLYAFHPGTMGGIALADILFGKVVPSGKLPVTFPRMVGQCPIYYNHNVTGRPASGRELLLDQIELEAKQTSTGCTSFYLDAGFGPLFPFGYGLSYTTFTYNKLTLQKSSLERTETLVAEFDLTNSGGCDGTEVVQLYISDLYGSSARPIKELKAFKRVSLKKGETQRVRMEVPIGDLAFWNIDMQKVVESGEHLLMIGGNSQEGVSTKFTVIE